jgi:hypothetical protein
VDARNSNALQAAVNLDIDESVLGDGQFVLGNLISFLYFS